MSSQLIGNYTANVPQGNQQYNNTQLPIQTNFQDIAQFIAINHVPFNTADTFGNHNVVDYFAQTSDPITGPSEMALYSKNVTNSTNISELFYRYPNSGNIVQLTGSSTVDSSTATGSGGAIYLSGYYPFSNGNQTAFGFQYLPGGALMKWGILFVTPSTQTGTVTVPFPIAPTGSTQIPLFTVNPFHFEFNSNYPVGSQGNALPYGEIQLSPVSTTQFSVQFNQKPYPGGGYYGFGISWMAIGA